MTASVSEKTLLAIHHLEVRVKTGEGFRVLLRCANLQLSKGETVIITGPSGAGKSTLALAILRLLPEERFTISGSIRLLGEELLFLSEIEMQRVRGNRVGLALQDAHAALNPLIRVGKQIAEGLVEHGLTDWSGAREIGLRCLDQLGFADPPEIWKSRPGELSGGMQQRVCLAISMVLSPHVLILDEPTANLDWETKHEVLETIDRVQSFTGCALLWLTHDQDVVDRYSDARSAVIRDGAFTA